MSLTIDLYGRLIWKNEQGQYHREKGPAIILPSGYIEYRLNNKPHRLDGPALICSDGTKEYWVDGKHYSKEEYWYEVKL